MVLLAKASLWAKRAGRLVPVVLIYYAMSIMFVASSKSILLDLPEFPWLLSFTQQAVAALCSRLWLAAVHAPGVMRSVSRGQWRSIAGASITCWLGFACANVACSVMNASLVETIKATTPIPQVMIAASLGDRWPAVHVWQALAVIIVGVMLASYADSTCCALGIIACITMNCNFALSDNLVKRSYTLPCSLDASNLWYRSAQVGALCAAPVAVAEVMMCGPDAKAKLDTPHLRPVALMVLRNGFAFWLYNQMICELLGLVSMPTFAVLGSVRRAVTVVAVTLYFGTEVTLLNATGLCVAAAGFVHFLRCQAEAGQSAPVGKATVVPNANVSVDSHDVRGRSCS